MNYDQMSPLTINDSTLDGSIKSPHRRKKVTWRNESDYMIQLTKGNKLPKQAKNLKAHEVDQTFNYGERDGKNVISNAEYQRNLIGIALFN
jgi:predicted phosphatase